MPPTKYSQIMASLSTSSDKFQNSTNTSQSIFQDTPDTNMQITENNLVYKTDIDTLFGANTSVSRISMQRHLGRWSNTVLFLSKAYHELLTNYCDEDPSLSILLNETASFNVRHNQFRRLMDKFKANQTRDLIFSQMSRDKHTLLTQTLRQLDQQFSRRHVSASSSAGTSTVTNNDQSMSQPLASHKVKVTFRDEPGEGTGVARSFYSAVADAFLTCRHVPLITTNLSTGTEKDGKISDKDISSKSSKDSDSSRSDNIPLFYRTSKSGYYTPIPGSNSTQRLNVFRNVGRMIGICLQQMEILPLHLCRHVLKFILNRPITWFDLAFYDPSMFDSLRSIVYNEEHEGSHQSEFYDQLQLTFSADIPTDEGGGTFELKPDGANIAVTRENVLEYVHLFVEHRLVGNHLKCLQAIRNGVFDVIPPVTISHLTSEDLRLILSGTPEISVVLLQSYTKFSDESSAPPEVLAKYKQQFWNVVDKFTSAEKQDLIFFWTGSPTLPSTEEGWQPLPTIMIRPADDHHLPTANTCISRLYVPLYSCKKILRAKLILAIKARNFGFV